MDGSITAEATEALLDAVADFLRFHDCSEAVKVQC